MATRLRWSTDGTKAWGYDKANPLTRNEKTLANKKDLDSDFTWAGSVDSIGWNSSWMFEFPDLVQLSKMIVNVTPYGGTNTIRISADSTDGVDGSWTTVNTDSLVVTTNQVLTLSPVTNCKWLKFTVYQDYHGITMRTLQFFGEYTAPWFEFWNSAESSEFTAEYPLALPEARTDADYSERVQFKIKNVDSITHSFTVTAIAVRSGGDAFITDHFKLSTDGGSTKTSSITLTGLTAGSFSGTIDLWGDVTKAHNVGDGTHYIGVEVVVTA
jgi:hypothetical protein